MAHFAYYIKRKIVMLTEVCAASKRCSDSGGGYSDQPYYAEDQPTDQGFDKPSYHSAPRSPGAVSRAKAGDTIWLFAQVESPWGKLWPSLDAKVIVSQVEFLGAGEAPRYRFAAAPESKWLPLFDARELLTRLLARNQFGAERPLLARDRESVGQALRFHREVANPDAIQNHCEYALSKKHNFISYRMIDGTEAAFECAKGLLESGRSVWWDRWSFAAAHGGEEGDA
jgi:hypothetical protein